MVSVSVPPGPTWPRGAPVPLRVSSTRVGPAATNPLLAATVTAFVNAVVAPLSSLTVSVTWYEPTAA